MKIRSKLMVACSVGIVLLVVQAAATTYLVESLRGVVNDITRSIDGLPKQVAALGKAQANPGETLATAGVYQAQVAKTVEALAAATRDLRVGDADWRPVAESMENLQREYDQLAQAVRSGRDAAALEERLLFLDDAAAQLRERLSMLDVALAKVQGNAVADERSTHGRPAQAAQQADQGREVVRRAIESVASLEAEMERATAVIDELGSDSQAIGKMLVVINGVAEQTNMLALNAAIEAARAGEQGRGFAVVADEVRTLATRAQKSTQEIEAIIAALQGRTRDAIKVMHESRAQLHVTSRSARDAGTALEAIARAIGVINDMNTQIAGAAEEQSAVSGGINDHIAAVAQIADESLSGTSAIVESSEHLTAMARDLLQRISCFSLQQAGHPAA